LLPLLMADFSQYETILYLDDMRKPLLPNAVQVRNYEEFVRYLKTRPMPDAISFDHDLTLEHYPTYEEEEECYRTNRINYENYSTKTGMDAVRYIIENKLPLKRWFVHSYNEVGTANMTALLMKYNPKGYDPSLRELPFELEEQEVWGGKVKDGFRQESAIAVQTAERMLSEVDPQACGTSKVMDGFWIETHTIGCRNSADTPEENWWDEHYEIYDEYSKDGISTVIGDPGDGKFVTITPQRKTAPKVAGYEPWMRYWLTGGCDLFALALYERIPAARFIGVFGKNSNHHVGLEKDGSYYDVRGKMRKEEFLQGLAAQEIRLVSRDNVIGFFGQGMWLHHEDELAKTSEMREARKAVNRVFGSGRHTAAATTYREEVTFLDQSYGLEDATTSTGLERVVWERPTRSKRPLKGGKPSVIKTNTVEQIGFANNAQYPHIRALHVSGDTEFWFNQLVKDYGRDAKAWVVEIKPVKGDYLMDDVSYSMPDQWGNKADSYILITSRTELIEGKDFKYVRELGPEDLIEDNSEEGYDPDYKFSEQASLKTAMASKIAGPLTVKPKNSLLRPKTAIGDKGWSYDEPAPDRNSFFEDVENPHSEQPLHVAANEADDFSEDAMYKALEVQNQMAWEVLTEYQTALKGKNVNYRQKWRVVPSARLKKIWSDYANTGFVRDEAGINEIADIVVENIFKIDVNTILCGHTATNPESWASEVLDIEIPRNRDYFEKLPHFFDDEEGSWRISDSAMPGLEDLAIRLMDARTGEQKLQIIDRILQIAHPRSDIAGWLVSGGRNTLNYLFEHGTREEPAPGPGYKTVDKFDKARERQQHLQKALKKRKLKGAAEADKWLSQCRTKDAALAGEVKVLPSTGGWKDAQGIDHFHHAIEIVRPGRPVENGVVTVAIADAAPEVMEITWIGGPEGTGFTKFNLGVGGFREVIRQLKSHHPGIIWVKGVRVSGADPGHTMEHAASLYDENPLPPTDGPPPEGYIRIYRGVNPERNSFAQSDDTHGYWYTTTYENAVSYANWDWDSEGELGPGRAILAVDVPLDMAFEFAQSGSRRRIMSPDELLDDERPVEMLVDHATSRAARVVEGDPEEGEMGKPLGVLAPVSRTGEMEAYEERLRLLGNPKVAAKKRTLAESLAQMAGREKGRMSVLGVGAIEGFEIEEGSYFLLADGSAIGMFAEPHDKVVEMVGGFNQDEFRGAIRLADSNSFRSFGGELPTPAQRAVIGKLVRGSGEDKVYWDFGACSGKGTLREFFAVADSCEEPFDYKTAVVRGVWYHGTTPDRAEIIRQQGLKDPSLHSIIKQGLRRSTTKDFLIAAQSKHGNKYDYSKVEYVGSKAPITIICPEHDEFRQAPANHIRGAGCPVCAIIVKAEGLRSNTEEFISKAKKVHGGKYEYGKSEYVNSSTPIIISCPEHGEFEQRPSSHLTGRGCPACKAQRIGDLRLGNTEKFIYKAVKTHGYRYDYSKVDYVGSLVPVTIICPKHGEFKQIPTDHLRGAGCPTCLSSHGEINTRVVLEQLGFKQAMGVLPGDFEENTFKNQYRSLECKDKRPLPFDFAVWKDGNLHLIEFQGRQHYDEAIGGRFRFGGREYTVTEEAVRDIQRKDRIKSDFCVSRGIPLLIIHYWEMKNIKNLVEEFLRVEKGKGGTSKTAAPKSIWYHGSSIKNLRSILKQGLILDPKEKNWGSDPSDGETRPSRVSYGGNYISRNLLTAIGSPKDHNIEGRDVIVCVEVQPNTLYLDEDSVVFYLQAPLGQVSDDSSHTLPTWLAVKFPEEVKGWEKFIEESKTRYIKDALRGLEYKYASVVEKAERVIKGFHPELRKRLEALLPEVWFAALTRIVSHQAKKASNWDIREAGHRAFSDKDEYPEAAKVRAMFPSPEEGEAMFRNAVEKVTRAMRLFARPMGSSDDVYNFDTARVTEPIGYGGSNRIIAVVEILDGRKYRGDDWKKPARVIVHYGQLPPEFFVQYKEKMGHDYVVERAPVPGQPSDALPAENYNRPKPVPPIDWEANQEKIEESKAASKTAAAKEPWQLTKEEFIADPPEGFEYRPGPHRWEAYRMSRGLTLVGDTFFEGDEDSRRMTLNHEVGHDLMTDFNRDFKDVLAPFRLDHKPPEAPMDASTSFDNAFGSRNNPEEIVADTYAALFEGGYKWYTEDPKYINLVKRVVEVAQREGLPVPPEALRHFGGNVKTAAAPDSENFKAWFGKSKVVNPDGSPKVMYHGSPNAKSYRSEWTDDLKKAVRLAFEHINKPYPGDDNVDKNLDSWVDTVYEFDRRNRNVIPKEVLVGMGLRKVPFETFDERLRGKNVGPGYPDAKVGFFFTPDQNFARRFTYHVEVDFLGQKRIIDGYAPHIFEVYLRIENPLDLTNRTKANARSLIDSGVLYREGVAPENQWTAEEVFNALRSTDGSKTLQKALANNQDKLIPAGYDGIINRVKEGQYDKSNLEYIVFHPNQIKATTAKEFSREDARMTAAKRPVYPANWGTHLKKIKSAAASPDKPEGPPEAPQGSPKPVKTAASSGGYISSGGKPMTFYRGEASGERRSTSSTPRRQAGCSSSLRTPSTPNGMPEAGRNIGSFISRQRMSWT